MPISRRELLKLLTAAGVTISANDWLLSRLETYGNERLAFRDVRGPGLESFSRTVCRSCANHCSLAVRKVDEFPVGLRGTPWHPTTLGALCMAGQSQLQAVFDPDRLEKPLLRPDAGAPASPVEWDEALGMLEGRLGDLLSEGAGERFAVVDGRTPSLGTRLLESWVRSIAGARYIPLRIEGPLDRLARDFLGGAPGGRLGFDLAHAGTLLLVGSELLEIDGSPVAQMRAHGDRREDPLLAHAPTVYLGPRQSPTAARADYWIPCHPGQERDIVLSLAEALSKEHPERASILPEYARWVSEARDPVGFARRFSLENVAQRLGVALEDLEAAVRALKEFAPAVALPGPGVLRRAHGLSTARAALALNLWTGGFREQGGLSWQRDPLADVAGELGFPAPVDPDPASLPGILQPLFEIRRSPVDVLFCVEADLVHELPGRDQIARALSHVPFLASFSSHEDETSRLSHVTIPTLLELESWDLPAPAWGAPDAPLQVQRPALIPVVEARSVDDVILQLGSSGLAGPGFSAPAADSKGITEGAVDAIVKSGRGQLVTADGEQALASLDAKRARRALLSGEAAWRAEAAAGPPGRGQVRASAPPGPVPPLAREQLWLVPFDGPALQRGRILNRPMMMELSGMLHGIAWEPWLEMHPGDAGPRGIRTGNRVIIRGPRAEIEARAVVTRSVDTSVVAMPVGFGHEALGSVAAGKGASPLELPYAVFDAESGMPAWGPVPVFVEKA